MMGKASLQEAARVIEHSLKGGAAGYTPEQMDALGRELNTVIGEFAPLLNEPKMQASGSTYYDKAKASPDPLNTQMEDFEYELVLEELDAIRGSLEAYNQ